MLISTSSPLDILTHSIPSLKNPVDKKTESSFLDIEQSGLIEISDGWLTEQKVSTLSDSSGVYVGSMANMGTDLAHIEKHLSKPKDFFDCLNNSYNHETLLIHVPD